MMMDITAPDATRRGIEDDRTRVRSHPLINAITKPPTKVEISCTNFPTCTNTLVKPQDHHVHKHV
jgi:hypothetical protein